MPFKQRGKTGWITIRHPLDELLIGNRFHRFVSGMSLRTLEDRRRYRKNREGHSWLHQATPVEHCPDYGDEQFQG